MHYSSIERLSLIALAAVTLVLYGTALDSVPANLHDAEIQFGLHARAPAASGHDTNGRFLPLYLQMPQIGDNVWFHPFIAYWTAIFLWFLPFSETAVRFPTAVLAVVNVMLATAVARRMFRSGALGILAGFITALTPSHFLHGRVAMDYLHPTLFVWAWLWCLVRFEETRAWHYVYLGSLVLGLGVYSYIASVMMMPLYLIGMLTFLGCRGLTPRRSIVLITFFALPLLAAVAFVITNPIVIEQTVARYAMGPPDSGAMMRARWYLNYNALQDQLSVYFDFFNPAYLFLAGGTDLMNSTRMAGVLLIGAAPLLAVGLYRAGMQERTPMNLMLAFGFWSAPVAATFVRGSRAVDRELVIIPFATSLCVLGWRALREDGRLGVRNLALLCLVVMPVQFGPFLADYYGDYRARSSGAFENNLRGAVEEMDRHGDITPHFYLSKSVPYALSYWRFALAKHERGSLEARTSVVDLSKTDLAAMPPNSIVLGRRADVDLVRGMESGQLRLLYEAPEFGADPVFALFQRP